MHDASNSRQLCFQSIRPPARLALALFTALSLLAGPALAAKTARPNIILIVADDLGFSDVGCYGGEIRTPNIDRLAAEGLRLTQFYNNAQCALSRVSMMTGLYPRFGQGGLLRNVGENSAHPQAHSLLHNNMVTIAEVLQQAGYATAMSGKWHLGGHPTRPIDRGFQEYYGIMTGAVNHFDPNLPDPPGIHHPGPPHPFVHNATPVTSVPENYYATDAFVDHAVAQIRALSKGDKPYFLHLAFTAPHYPIQAPPEDIARYKGHYQEGYGVLRQERYRRLVELELIPGKWQLPPPDRKLGDVRYDLEPEAWDSLADQGWESAKMEIYAAMVDRMDQGIGRVMAALKESGADENTLVIFFSDNGGCASDFSEAAYQAYKEGRPVGGKDTYFLSGPGWATVQSSPFRRYKTWTYEGGVSTPMIVRWPAGRVRVRIDTRTVGHVVDLMPTLLDVAGASYPARFEEREILPTEGISLKPAVVDGAVPEGRELGWYLYGNRAYRSGKWKIVWGVTAKRWELYDMEADRTETNDLAAQHPDIVRRLTASWRTWAQRNGAAQE